MEFTSCTMYSIKSVHIFNHAILDKKLKSGLNKEMLTNLCGSKTYSKKNRETSRYLKCYYFNKD